MDNQNSLNTLGTSASPDPGSSPSPSIVTGAPDTQKKKWWMIGGIVAVVVLLVAGALWFMMGSSDKKEAAVTTPTFRIGLSLDTFKELRWQKDKKLIEERAEQLGGSVTTLVADSDDTKQVEQIENLIAQKVDVIIIVAHNGEAVAPTIAKAHEAGIEVIAYDRLIPNSDLDLFITFDSSIIGKYEAQYVMDAVPASITTANVALVGGADTDNNSALIKKGIMGVLDPLITSGKVKIVYDKQTPEWSPDTAYSNIKAFLDGGGKVDAVIAANDGTAGGVIKALKAHGLDGKIPVSGGDAELPAVQRVAAGTQTVTVYTPFKNVAYRSVDLALQIVKNQKPSTNGFMNNGQKDVPAVLLDSTPVTKANLEETIIKAGVFTKAEVYETATE